MEQLSLMLLYLGAICMVIAFIALVVHATLLATASRSPVAVFGTTLAAAGAGGGSATIGASGGPTSAASATTAGGIGQAMTWATVILFGLSLAIRGYLEGRGPWGNMFEFTAAFAFGVVAGYLYLGRRYPIRAIGFLPLGVALFLTAYAISLPTGIEPLVPALSNPELLTVHVLMAIISYGIFATSFGAAVAYLAQGPNDRYSWLPSHKVLDEVAYRAVIVGFPIFATLIILGSWWASIAWGRYWGWDPIETSALTTWLIYAVYLHARNLKGWAGRPAALILVVGFGGILFTYFGLEFFNNSLHAYSGLPVQ